MTGARRIVACPLCEAPKASLCVDRNGALMPDGTEHEARVVAACRLVAKLGRVPHHLEIIDDADR